MQDFVCALCSERWTAGTYSLRLGRRAFQTCRMRLESWVGHPRCLNEQGQPIESRSEGFMCDSMPWTRVKFQELKFANSFVPAFLAGSGNSLLPHLV